MKIKTYQPPKKILEKYADVLVNFALGGGKGIKKGETILVQGGEVTKPLYVEIVRAIWKAGGHVIQRYSLDVEKECNLEKDFYALAEEHQLDFFPEKYLKGIVDQADHSIFILAETDPHSLEGIHPKKIMRRSLSQKRYREWRDEKESAGKFTWTLALFGTEAMAKEAKMPLKKYWEQIINACFLDENDPIAEWKKIYKKIDSYRAKLNRMPIVKLNIVGDDCDLWITIGENRQWLGGGGRNIPSFEIFTSPDWRGTEGFIRFNQPLYRYGNLVEGIELEFKNGLVVKSSAKKNEKVLKEMIASPNADKIGEFSLTDNRFSRITKFMAETLFDENMGGKEGNTHIALGAAYHDTFTGNPSKPSKKQWEKMGFNDSVVHTDIISTSPRTVTAYLKDGSQKVIYKNGQFTI